MSRAIIRFTIRRGEVKIAAISDLHLDINKDYPVLDVLKEEVEKENADYLIIAGDIYEDFRNVIGEMRMLENGASFRVLYVPGNHDLWSPEPHKYKVDYIYSSFCDDERCLSGKYVIDRDVAFIGDVGWYDHSFGNHERFSDEMFAKMYYMGRTWQDSIKNPWTRDNMKRCDMQLDALSCALDMVRGKKVVAVTHMLPIREFTVLDARPEWEYFNAFLGSEKLGELFENKSVSYSISGHVHYRKEIEKNGVHYICPCLGYKSEWKFAKGHEEDLTYHIQSSLRCFEL